MPAIGLKAFEYGKHFLGWLTVSAVRHQFRITQDGIERRAQFMTHVGEKLRLVLARDLKLPVLVLDSSNNRTFSIAIAAWSANVVTSSICLSVNGCTSERVKPKRPIGTPSRSIGTQRIGNSPISVLQPRYILDRLLRRQYEVEGRTADDLEHIGGRGLLLQRLAQFVEQSRISMAMTA